MIARRDRSIGTLESISAKTRHSYNLAAERYHELFHDEMNRKAHDRTLLDSFAARFDDHSLVLDAGCGPCGHIGRYVFDKGVPVIGVDISENCIDLAMRHNPGMRFECADLAALPFPDDTFSGVLSYYSIIDTPRHFVDRIFGEFHRVLQPGGSLLVVVKSGTTEGFVEDLIGIPTEIYFTLFTEGELSAFLEGNGFDLELLETRAPYDFEIEAERLYAIGRKRPHTSS